MTPRRDIFVAREFELAQLNKFLDCAQTAQGQICFVTGEAGSGKTALVTEFARRAEKIHPDLVVAVGNCSAQAGIGDPYLPFREILALLTGDADAKLSERTISPDNSMRLRGLLRWSGNALLKVGPDLIGALVPGTGLIAKAGAFVVDQVGWPKKIEKLLQRKAAHPGAPQLEPSRLFEQYTGVLQTLAAKKLLMLVIDDLQWADTSSISLLFHLSRHNEKSRILLVGTYRPDEVSLGRAGQRHPLEPVLHELKRYYGDIWVDLSQTAEAEGRQFVDAFLDTEPNRLGNDFRQALFRHTGGHPLFTVELLRDMQERRDLVPDKDGCWIEGSTLNWDELPARVEGVIEERIGRLEKELQELLTVASVEGEAFTAEVVARVQSTDVRRLSQRLSRELDKQHRLVYAQGVLRLGQQRLSLYRFQHNLFQKYLYNNLDEVERSYLHEDMGKVLEELYGDQAEDIALQLARHFQEAAMTEKAIHYLRLAAEKATRIAAFEDAIALLTKGLDLIRTMPQTPERAGQELQLNIALGTPLALARGFAAPEVAQVFAKARELCRQVEETPQLFPVLFGLFRFYHVRVELHTAHELGEQLLHLAQQVGNSTSLLQAHLALALTSYSLGEIVSARAHFEQGLALYDPQQQRVYPALFGHDPAVASHSFIAQVLWSLGYPDQALTESSKAQVLAEQLVQPFNQAWSLCFAAIIHQYRGEPQVARERAEAAIALCIKHELPQWLAMGKMLQGWALAELGKAEREAAIQQIREGLADWMATGAKLGLPAFLALLIEQYLKLGQTEDGLSAVAEGLEAIEKYGEHWWEPELHRLRGELLLQQGEKRQAELSFKKALDVARQQQVKSLELRAAKSLSRLRQNEGQRDEARHMLAEIYNWFTEGFETPDLREARTLLAEM